MLYKLGRKIHLKKEIIKEVISQIRKVISDKQRKSIIKILYELLNYFIVNKDFPLYYSKHMLHRKDAKNYLDYYIGKKEHYKIRRSMMDIELIRFLENKVLFHWHFKESNLKLPEFLGYNLGKEYFSQYGIRHVHDLKSFCNIMEELMKRTGVNSIFAKPISGIGGRDCFKIDAKMLNPGSLAGIYDKIGSSKYLFQRTIDQHPLINAIYPHSVNTLRVHTCIYLNGKIDVISIAMKFGSKGKFVEAGGTGTILISVDMDTGALGPYAFKNFEWGGDIYIRHPDTGFEFAGFIVPHFEAVKDMAKAAAMYLPYRLVGWDVALTEEGPVLIEGNHNFGFWAGQIADRGFKKNKVFKQFFDELNNT